MHLRSIRMKGFKSFPNRVRLDFSPGVSVIVGPNGSGKSNITDAVLWALGEQSPLAVRGQKMQDVIFAGGPGVGSRKAAEVEVVIDNGGSEATGTSRGSGEGEAGTEFSELSIIRRLDRSGEGEYRINGGRCRLVDVIEALSDTGLGKEMHSVVSQGRVEAIIHSKPRDRRLLIEEAAGLSKHRKRRRRTHLKLERTQDNLARALDIEREARSHLRPLKRQAEAAELHERLERQSNEARLALASDSLRGLRAELAEAEAAATAARSAREAAEGELKGVAARREAAEQALATRSQAREQRANALFSARSTAEAIGLRLERARDIANAAGEEATRCEAQLAALDGDAPVTTSQDGSGPNAPPAPGAVKLLDHISAEPEFEPAAERLLADVWVVNSLDDVGPEFNGLCVTRDGLALSGAGALGQDPEERSRAERLLKEMAERERRERARRRAVLEDRAERQQALETQAKAAGAALEAAAADVGARRAELEAELGDSERAGDETTAELRECARAEAELQGRLRAASESVTETEVAAQKVRDSEAELAHEAGELAIRLGFEKPEEPGTALGEDERDELERKIERLARRREQLGPVNPLAKGEYEEAVARVDELEASRQDLESALSELEQIIRDIDKRIKERFEETFEIAAKNFEDVVQHLFPGGRGRLRLVKPDGPRPVIGGEQVEDGGGRRRRRRGSRRGGGARGARPRARRRGRGDPRRQVHAAALTTLRRREVARRARLHVRRLPRPAVPVLHPRRGRGRARRPQHRPLPPAARPLLRQGPVHRRHPPEADDGRRRHAIRGQHGRRRRLEGDLAPAGGRSRARRRRLSGA